MKGLYVEDDLELSSVVIESLQDRGIQVHWVRGVQEAIDKLKSMTFDFYLVDVGLTDGTGYEVADYLKDNNLTAPLIFITARSNAEDRLKGYEYGACEYIPKPFLFEELWMRLEHALSEHGDSDILKISEDVELHVSKMFVYLKNQESEIELNKKETLFLKKILQKSPQPIRRSEILDSIWNKDSYPTERTVDNLVVKLRQKLGPISDRIVSVRGVGYKWSDKNE